MIANTVTQVHLTRKKTRAGRPPLLGVLASLADWRKQPNKVYALTTLLTVLLAGLLCGKKGVKPISHWCRGLPLATRMAMGFPFGRKVSAKMLDRVLAHPNPNELESALCAWLAKVNEQYAGESEPARC